MVTSSLSMPMNLYQCCVVTTASSTQTPSSHSSHRFYTPYLIDYRGLQWWPVYYPCQWTSTSTASSTQTLSSHGSYRFFTPYLVILIVMSVTVSILHIWLFIGDCNGDQFIIRANEPLPVLCGNNSKQHLYVDVRGRKETNLNVLR